MVSSDAVAIVRTCRSPLDRGTGRVDLLGDGGHDALRERLDVLRVLEDAGRLDRRPEGDDDPRAERRAPPDLAPRPPGPGPPDPARDDRHAARERDARGATLAGQQDAVAAQCSLREDAGQAPLPDDAGGLVQRPPVAGPATDGNLPDPPESPSDEGLAEVLGRRQESHRAPGDRGGRHRDDHRVEHADVVAGEDRAALGWDVLPAAVPDPEQQPEQPPEDPVAARPPRVAAGPVGWNLQRLLGRFRIRFGPRHRSAMVRRSAEAVSGFPGRGGRPGATNCTPWQTLASGRRSPTTASRPFWAGAARGWCTWPNTSRWAGRPRSSSCRRTWRPTGSSGSGSSGRPAWPPR